jgi:hypothetical protein
MQPASALSRRELCQPVAMAAGAELVADPTAAETCKVLPNIATKSAKQDIPDTACPSPDSVLQHRPSSDAETSSEGYEMVDRSPQEPSTPASTSTTEPLLADNPERFCLLPVE